MNVRNLFLLGVLIIPVSCSRATPATQVPVDSQVPVDLQVSGDVGGPVDLQVSGDVGGELPESLWTRTAGVDWPSFLGPDRNGKSPETGILTDWSPAGPRVVWQRELSESYGIGSVSRGRYFQFDCQGAKAVLTCMHAETGQTLWEFDYPTSYVDMYGYNGGPRCSPVIDGPRVYIYGVEGMLYCLRVADGDLIWKCDTARQFGVVQNFFGVGSTPIVEGDLLIVIVGGSPADEQSMPRGQLNRVSGNGSGIVAFDKLTGEVKYSITDELAGYASPVMADIEGRRWGFAFCRGGLIAFEPRSGSVDFQYPWRAGLLESVNASTPVVAGNEVFISETYGPGSALLRVKPGGYDVAWRDDTNRRQKAMKAHWSTPIYHDGYLYGCSGRNSPDAELRRVQWKTGKVMWSIPKGVHTTLLHVDGHFVCLEERGKLQLLRATPQGCDVVAEAELREQPRRADAGAFAPKRLLNYPCWAAPILAHGLLYVRGKDRLVCLELIPAEPMPAERSGRYAPATRTCPYPQIVFRVTCGVQGRSRPFSASAVIGPCLSTGRPVRPLLPAPLPPAASGGGREGGGDVGWAAQPGVNAGPNTRLRRETGVNARHPSMLGTSNLDDLWVRTRRPGSAAAWCDTVHFPQRGASSRNRAARKKTMTPRTTWIAVAIAHGAASPHHVGECSSSKPELSPGRASRSGPPPLIG